MEDSLASAPTLLPSSNDDPLLRGADGLDDALREGSMRERVLAGLFPDTAPQRIGRFRVLDRLGAGGMGIVYTAYDEHLDRKIAVKVVREARARDDARDDGQARARLLREARALARLSHVNVVAVHEVGEHDGQVYVAMEFVRGRRLDRWLAAPGEDDARARPWRVIVDMFIQAGNGLAAAHEAGIIHRDFKPPNAIVSEEGVLKVLDFGLARDAQDAQPRALTTTFAETPLDPRASTLTRAGAILGTPAYMSPEQLRGEEATAQSDQFSFCVALHEALYGARPFAGATLKQLALNVLAGHRARPSGTTVPGWLDAIVARGLRGESASRWPSMRALVDALGDDPSARRRRRARSLAAAGLVVGSALALGSYARAMDQRCKGASAEFAEAWNAGRRAAVLTAMTGTGLSYARTSAESVTRTLDEYAERWAAARVDACEDTRIREEQTPALMEARLRCLDDRRRAAASIVRVLEEVDESSVGPSSRAVLRLPRIELCADAEYVTAAVKPPEDPATRATVAALRERLERVNALVTAGRYQEASALCDALAEEVAAARYPPLNVERSTLAGLLAVKLGDYQEAARALEPAYFEARALKHDELAAEAAYLLGWSVGYGLARYEEGARWARHILADVQRGTIDPELEVKALSLLGVLAELRSDFDEAVEHHDKAVALAHEVFGAESPSLSTLLLNRGSMHSARGAHEQALADYERGVELHARVYGESHPVVADLRSSIGLTYSQLGRIDEALEQMHLALEVSRAAYGESTELATVQLNVGVAYTTARRHHEAEQYLVRAYEVFSKLLGPAHPDVALARTALAVNELELGRFDSALAHFDAALAINVKAYGENNEQVATTSSFLGDAYRTLKRYDDAIAAYTRAITIWEQLAPDGHPRVVTALSGRGSTYFEREELTPARTDLERACALAERLEVDPEDHAKAELVLSRTLVALDPSSTPRALTLTRSAARRLDERASASAAELRDEMRAWVASLEGRP